MKIAIIGGAGFVGSHLTRTYLDARHNVIVIDNLLHGTRESVDPRARFYHLDIRDERLRAILQAERPDVVSYHAIQRECELPGEGLLTDADVHVRGVLNVLESCVNAQVRKLIFASGGNSLYRGCALRDGETMKPISEEIEVYPTKPQDITRVAGEWYVRYYTRQYGLPHLILRYADIYGEINPTSGRHPLTTFLVRLAAQSSPTIRGTDCNVRDHIFIDDVVKANLSALTSGCNETLHISSGQGYSMRQLYQAVANLFQSKLTPVYISPSRDEPTAVILDNSRAGRVLNWQPTIDLAEGVNLASERLLKRKVGVNTEPLTAKQEEPVGAESS